MTGYTVHTGSNEKFTEGWDRIFSQGRQQEAGKKKAKRATGAAKAKVSGKARKKK